jgi:hypothetical protein
MFYADQVGLDQILRRVREFADNPHGDPAFLDASTAAGASGGVGWEVLIRNDPLDNLGTAQH